MPRTHRPSRARRSLLVVPLVLLAVTALAACGDDSSSSSGTTSTTSKQTTTTATSPGSAGTAATVSLGETDLGKVLVDADGRTLYAFTPDSATKSACTGSCAQAWPPAAATGTPTAGTGVTAKLTVLTRDDGTTQVVADGHPLYQYAGDAAAGDATGQGSGGKWYVVSAGGSPMKSAAGASSTTTTAGSSSGY